MEKYKRKIIPIGQTSFAVILPIGWLRYNNLSKGDHVEVISNGILKIIPEKVVKNNTLVGYSDYKDFEDFLQKTKMTPTEAIIFLDCELIRKLRQLPNKLKIKK